MTILLNEKSSCMCGSMSFTENREGFQVCLGCGQLQYDSNIINITQKYEFNLESHMPTKTMIPTYTLQMGTKIDKRLSKMKRVWKLERLNKMENYAIRKKTRMYFEIKKLISGLKLADKLISQLYNYYLIMQNKIPKKFRINDPARLSAVLLYNMAQNENLGISIEDIANITILTKSQIYKYLSEFQYIFQTKRNNANNLIIAKISDICQKNNIDSKIEMEAVELLENAHSSNTNIIATSLVYIALRNNNIKIAPHRLTNKTPGSNGSVYVYVKKYLKYPEDYSFVKMAKEVWKN